MISSKHRELWIGAMPRDMFGWTGDLSAVRYVVGC